VLLILDCDYQTTSKINHDGEGDSPFQRLPTTQGVGRGKTELLAAPSLLNSNPRNESRSFTSAVIESFEEFRGSTFTINQLHAKICRLVPGSIYMKLTEQHHSGIKILPPIHLTHNRFVDLDIDLNRRFSQTTERDRKAIIQWVARFPPGAMAPHLDELPHSRMKFTVPLMGSSIPKQSFWKEWLGTQAPSIVNGVSVSVKQLAPGGELEDDALELDGLESLAASLNINTDIRDAFAKGKGEYAKVSVLPLLWDKQDPKLGLEEELLELSKLFRKFFGFNVYDIHRIEMAKPNWSLSDRVTTLVKEHDCDDELVIVVYAGHGIDTVTDDDRDDNRGDAIWAE
jgi:hypothetical protein